MRSKLGPLPFAVPSQRAERVGYLAVIFRDRNVLPVGNSRRIARPLADAAEGSVSVGTTVLG